MLVSLIMHSMYGTMNCLSIWRRQETSVSSMNLFGYLMQMKQGFPWLHSQQQSLLVRETPMCTNKVAATNLKSQITILMTSNTVALYIPPLVVYPGCNFCQTFIEKFYSHFLMAIFGHSTNGWKDADLFKKWLEESFIPEIDKACIPKPLLLIINRAKCHISLPISELCNENNNILYTLLLNATHLIQPLDLSLMGSIKTNYRECVRKWLQNNLSGVYDKNAFIEVFAEVHKKSANVENTVSGFRHAGIFP